MFIGRNQIIYKKPYKLFLLFAFVSSTIGISIDTVSYIRNSQILLLTLNSVSLVALLTGITLLLRSEKLIRLCAAILIYSVVLNIYISDVYMAISQNPVWVNNSLRDLIITTILFTVAGLILNRGHVIASFVLFAAFISTIAFITSNNYIIDNIAVIIIVVTGYSSGTVVFVKFFHQTTKENNDLLLEIAEKNRLMLQYENELMEGKMNRLNESIELKNQELLSKAMFIASVNQANEQISRLLESCKNSKESHIVKTADEIQTIIKTSNNHAYWDEFRARFEDVHQSFYNNLKSEHPDLTKTELRLCAFLKLGLSSKEIALLTQNTKASIDVARSRLRKKMNIDKSENFNEALLSY